MSTDKNSKYHAEVYKAIADLYIMNRLSLKKACAKVGISKQTYYNICRKLDVPSVSTIKEARLDYISSDNFETNNI
jgi:DNA-binding XRE family transcriptional regulator